MRVRIVTNRPLPILVIAAVVRARRNTIRIEKSPSSMTAPLRSARKTSAGSPGPVRSIPPATLPACSKAAEGHFRGAAIGTSRLGD